MMIRHIYQYELDFACTSASGILYTLAKEKLNMSKFTNTLIASTLAVAVAGPASADVDFGGYLFADAFVSNKTLKVKVNPSNCKTTKFDFATSTLKLTNEIADGDGFKDLFEFEEAGFWELEGFTWTDLDPDLAGIYTTRKLDKELTPSMHRTDLGYCADIDDGEGGLVQDCIGLAEVIQTSLIAQGCGRMTNVQSLLLDVTKSQIKFSKKGDRAKVDIQVEGEYINTKGDLKAKKVKVTIKGSNYDKVLVN
jgi:hypothetical protein